MVASLAGPAAGTPRALRRPCQGRPGPGEPASLDSHDVRGAARARRVLRNRGLTVVAVPADTDYTIRLENVGTGLAHRRPRRPGTDRPRHRRLPSAQSRSPSSACRRPAGVRDEPRLPPGIAALAAREARPAPLRPSSPPHLRLIRPPVPRTTPPPPPTTH